ncbi:3-keto-disaccharide hydrolase [Verrucomicrobiota bacterium sgz303538]
MKTLLLSSLLALGLLVSARADEQINQLSEQEKNAGWQLLFDGKDASQWWRGYKKDKMPDGWVVKDGALVREKGGGDIITKDEFDSFEFSVDWNISEGGNSGVMFKVKETDGPPWSTGPEAQIQDNVKGHDPQKAGWMYGLYPATVDTTKPVGQWNTFVLKCQKTPAGTYKCEHTLNGTKYVEYEIGSDDWNQKVAKSKFGKMPGFAKAAEGHICLQDHGNLVSFRNIKLRKLEPLK